jgi:hypothetical protein
MTAMAKNSRGPAGFQWIGLLTLLCGLLLGRPAGAVGYFTQMATFPTSSVQVMLLLSDGTVMAQTTDGTTWYHLIPDSTGNYANGRWTNDIATMNDQREFYSSQVLTSGKVFVAGGEYGDANNDGTARAEVYDPVANSWAHVNPPSSLLNPTGSSPVNVGNEIQSFVDSISSTLPNGNVLIAPVLPRNFGGTLIFNPASATWTDGPTLASNPSEVGDQAEASWVKLADGSILTIDPGQCGVAGTYSERFIPSLNKWVPDATVPVATYDVLNSNGKCFFGENGAAFLLPNGKAFFLGASGHTAIYTPSVYGGTNEGSWSAGPNIPNGQVAADAPAAMLANGKILCAVAPAAYQDGSGNVIFPGPISFYEYDQNSGWSSAISTSPIGSVTNNATFIFNMLVLPDGTVLLSHRNGNSVFVYHPDPSTSPLAEGQPNINSVSWNSDGSLHLTGTVFNGISEGAAYGDDGQMDSNYPLVRFTSGGTVYYGRTYNWSSTGVQTGGQIVTTEVTVPPAVLDFPGNWSLQVVANGNASAGWNFYSPVWVDFNYSSIFNLYFGWSMYPWNTLPQGVSEIAGSYPGGTIAIEGNPSTGHESVPYTISTPMTIISISGAATIGN